MKDINNIEDWYRNELNNYNVEPDQNIWNSLSKDLDANSPLTDDNIIEWYKKEVTKLEEKPDYTVWERLSTKLDTTSVWDKLVVSLNRYDQFIWWRNLVFRGSAVFLLFFGSYLAYNNYASDKDTIASNTNAIVNVPTNTNSPTLINKKGNNSTNLTEINATHKNKVEDLTHSASKNSFATNKNLSSDKKINRAVKEAKSSLKAPLSNNDVVASITKEPHFNSISETNLTSLKTEKERSIFTEINRHHLTEQDISHLYSSGDFLVKKDKNKIVFNSKRFSSYFIYGVYARRLYIGVNIGVKKQGLISNIKKNSDLAKYNQNSFLDFGNNFGATVGYIVSDKFNLETNINFNSSSGYKRAYSTEGLSYQENLNLNYSSVSLLGKKMNTKSTFDNKVFSTNLIAGIYAGYLRAAVSEIDGTTRNLDEYHKTDFGIVLGIEQDRYITKTIIITPSVRYIQGILNIANANSSFSSARNFSFEFNLGVKYIFLKKSK